MGFGDLDFSEALGADKRFRNAVGDPAIRTLLAAAEDERRFLMAHALLAQTPAGQDASNDDWLGFKLSLKETAYDSGRWTGRLDGVKVEVKEDRPRGSPSSWGDEIWAQVSAPETTPAQRAAVCLRWHRRLDVTLWSERYPRLVLMTLGVPVMNVAAAVVGRRRRHTRRAAGRCVRCNYDLRATPDRCPECGTVLPAGKVNA
jgi:hypothetical protein